MSITLVTKVLSVLLATASYTPLGNSAPKKKAKKPLPQRSRNVSRPAPKTYARPNKPFRSANVAPDRIRDLIANQSYDEALRLLASSNEPSARVLRATIFEKMGYLHSALAELAASYRLRPNNQVLGKAGAIAFLLNDTRMISGLPADTVGMRLALAQDALSNGDVGRARSLLPSNQSLLELEQSGFKAKAMIMASSIYNAQGNARDALEVLGGNFSDTPGVDLAEIRLQRALILFEIRRYVEALDELTFITRASPTWYRGQLVGAWGAFHTEDYNLSLGQIMNLNSPFLAAKFNPEKYLLNAVVLFQLCHYESASRSLKKLKAEYGNMNGAFSSVAGATSSPATFYTQLRRFALNEAKVESTAMDRVWDGIASQPHVADISNSIEKLRFERKNIDANFRTRELQGLRAVLLRVFDRLEESYTSRLARYSRSLLDKMKNDVKETIEGALAADLEINTRVRDRLIRAATPVQKNIDFKKEVQKGYEFWPFEGEFWRDETGGYAFATTDVCEEGAR